MHVHFLETECLENNQKTELCGVRTMYENTCIFAKPCAAWTKRLKNKTQHKTYNSFDSFVCLLIPQTHPSMLVKSQQTLQFTPVAYPILWTRLTCSWAPHHTAYIQIHYLDTQLFASLTPSSFRLRASKTSSQSMSIDYISTIFSRQTIFVSDRIC